MQEIFSHLSDLDGYDDLKPEDQSKIRKALEGHIPESAKEGRAANDEGDKQKREAAKKRTRGDEEGEKESAEKSKKARTTKAMSVVRFIYQLPCSVLMINSQEANGEEEPKKASSRKDEVSRFIWVLTCLPHSF